MRIRQLSRLVAAKDAAATRKELAAGQVDIVIGTEKPVKNGARMRVSLYDIDDPLGVSGAVDRD